MGVHKAIKASGPFELRMPTGGYIVSPTPFG